jgi:S-adenosylmethionine:tRNA ribosyltransferase-isomerase
VGAGTFKPVDAERVAGHEMHAERFEVTLEFLEQLARALRPTPGRPPVIAVGTTSLRTLESLYWLGRRVALDSRAETDELGQWEAYGEPSGREVLPFEAIQALASRLRDRGLSKLVARTRIMIVPGYAFKTADWLLTNFHQPGSSLILLVAAWMGENWRKVYDHALRGEYRFLSYGDSSLLKRS